MSRTGGQSWERLLQVAQDECSQYTGFVQFDDGKLGVGFDDGGPIPVGWRPGDCKSDPDNESFVLVGLAPASPPSPPPMTASLTMSGELRGSSSVVTVKWADVQPPVGGWAASNTSGSRKDFIGIYENASWPNEGSPPFSDFLPRYCPPCVGSDSSVWEVWRLDPLHFGSGSGEANFTLFNMRTTNGDPTYQLHYVRPTESGGTLRGLTSLASSRVMSFPALEPYQIHLSGTGEPTSMNVLWTDSSDDTMRARVRYGLSPGSLDQVAHGSVRTYHADDMDSQAAVPGLDKFRNPGYIYTRRYSAATPSTDAILLSCSSSESSSPSFSSLLPPPPPPPSLPPQDIVSAADIACASLDSACQSNRRK